MVIQPWREEIAIRLIETGKVSQSQGSSEQCPVWSWNQYQQLS